MEYERTVENTEKGVLQQKAFGIEWTIKGFFRDCKSVGHGYESPWFSARCNNQVTRWYLQVYPKGENNESKNSVSLYLHFDSKDPYRVYTDHGVSVEFQMSIASRHGQPKLFEATQAVFKWPRDSQGWSDFAEQSIIGNVKNGYLIRDSLTILCEIAFREHLDDSARYHDYLRLGAGVEAQCDKYEQLLESAQFSDVTFNVQGQPMYLHKAIIMTSGSPVFQAMFEHEMKEKKENSVDVADVDYQVMKELFRFVYAGKVENIEKIAKDLLIAADKYAIAALKALCEKVVYDNLTVNNALDCLDFAGRQHTPHLRNLVFAFIVDHFKTVVKKPAFVKLDPTLMCEIIQAHAGKKK